MQTHGHGRFYSISIILLSIVSFSISNHALADASGKARYSGIVPGKICSSCHIGAAPAPTLTIAGPTTVAPGSVSSYTVTVRGGPAIAAGLNVAANAGALATNDAGTKLLGTEIVHSAPRAMTGGTASFTISWKAPTAAGPATLFAAGASTDGDTTDKGDGVGGASLAITVGAGAGAGPSTQPPVAVLKAPASGVAGIPFAFDGNASTAAAGSISQYNWNFGDNTAGSGATVTHTFAAGGYTVKLTVTDSAGATNSASVAIAVSTVTGVPPPIANPGGPYAGEINLPVQFDGSSSTDSAGPIASYSWDFADGTTDVGPQPNHTFTTEGSFGVALTVTNNAGVAATSQISVPIGPVGSVGGGVAANPLLGQTLYDDNCASCHGDGGGGGAGTGTGTVAPAIVGRSYKKIQDAIDKVPDMQPLADLFSKTDLKQVAGYLLYNTQCVSCHGVSGAGADDPAVAGTTTDALKTALEVVVEMQPLADPLSSTDIKEIVEYLNPTTASANNIAARARAEASISSATNGKITSVKPKAKAANGGGSDGMFLLIVGAWGAFARLRRAKFHNR